MPDKTTYEVFIGEDGVIEKLWGQLRIDEGPIQAIAESKQQEDQTLSLETELGKIALISDTSPEEIAITSEI